MIRIGTRAASLANRRPLQLANGTNYFKSDFIVSAPGDASAPQAFLIEQEPDSIIRSHFHMENQFQVVLEGEGSLGRHAVGPVSLHYANRQTGYGPVVAGPKGVTYLTLRDRVTAEAYYLPDSKHLLKDLPRRNLYADRFDVPSEASLRTRRGSEFVAAITPEPDGVAAWVAYIAPGQSLRVPAASGGADRFHLVTAGALLHEAGPLPRLAILYASADEEPVDLRGSESGAQVVVMQYPARVMGTVAR